MIENHTHAQQQRGGGEEEKAPGVKKTNKKKKLKTRWRLNRGSTTKAVDCEVFVKREEPGGEA